MNTACILFAASTIEALVNEWISIAKEIDDGDIPAGFWVSLSSMQKTLKLQDKWNLIASIHDGDKWDKGKEPFQSYELIIALRNELVHYKGQLLGKDETPNKKIKALLSKFGLKSKASFIGDDVSSWVEDLLDSEKLGRWAYSKTIKFYKETFVRLFG